METNIDRLPPHLYNDAEAVDAAILESYRALFEGRGGQSDANTVLVDLMQISGWNEILPPDATSNALADLNGSRRVMGRILFMLALPSERVRQLQEALLRTPTLNEVA